MQPPRPSVCCPAPRLGPGGPVRPARLPWWAWGRPGRAEAAATAGRADARDARLARLEALLMLAREPLSSRRLAEWANLADGTEARTLIRRLNQAYDADGRAFRVEEVAGGFQLLTRRKFAPWLRRVAPSPIEASLSGPALETLAVIAYRQPVVRATVEAIRGVQSSEMLRQLLERDLIRIVGRSPELGRPFLYGTTKLFLQTFGLRHLDELPRAESLRRPMSESSSDAILAADPPGADRDQKHPVVHDAKEEFDVRVSGSRTELAEDELLLAGAALLAPGLVRAEADDADEEWEEEEDEEGDDEDDLEDDEDDDEEEWDDEEDDDFDDDWEEVDEDDEEEWDDEEDDEDDDWEDDDEDDEDEEEEWEEEGEA